MDEVCRTVNIHMCDDDIDDQFLTQEMITDEHLISNITFSSNGKELLEFLNHEGQYGDLAIKSIPDLILINLNMLMMTGQQLLEKLKDNDKFHSIPIIILTISKAEQDLAISYGLGASTFIVKPITFDNLVKVVTSLNNFQIKLVCS